MTGTGDADPDAQFTGKYVEGGRVGGWLVDRFYDCVRGLLQDHASPDAEIVEIGSGAGYSTQRIHSFLPSGTSLIGSEIGESLAHRASRLNPEIDFLRQSVYSLAMPDRSADVLIMLEVLEHLDDPDAALAELHRVARHLVILSTPREPLWRILNMARGRYLTDFGNTPGHIQHWSSRGLRRKVSQWFDVIARRQPIPWTILALQPRR